METVIKNLFKIIFTIIIVAIFSLNCITSERDACKRDQYRGVLEPQTGTCQELFLLSSIELKVDSSVFLQYAILQCLREKQVAKECNKKSQLIPTLAPM